MHSLRMKTFPIPGANVIKEWLASVHKLSKIFFLVEV